MAVKKFLDYEGLTQWVTKIQEALWAIKKKYNLNGQVSVFVFKTKKIAVQL